MSTKVEDDNNLGTKFCIGIDDWGQDSIYICDVYSILPVLDPALLQNFVHISLVCVERNMPKPAGISIVS